MSRLLLQMVAGAVNAAPAAAPAPHANNSGMARSGVIYTFTFIGASVLAGLLFLGLMFKYMITYRMWGPPITLPLQARVTDLTTGTCERGVSSVVAMRDTSSSCGTQPCTSMEVSCQPILMFAV